MGKVILLTVKITSLPQFIKEISAIEIEKESRMFPPKLVFRGQSSTQYGLVPSLGRRPSPTRFNSWAFVEKDLVRSAQQKFPLLFPDSDYPVILLAKLQHYGVPTRLLDVTHNALVALFFACNDCQGDDGEVFAFSADVLSAYDPTPNAIADTYRLTGNAYTPIENYYYRTMKQPYSARILHPGWENNMSTGIRYLIAEIQKPVFVEVGNVCERQIHQKGLFLLFPNKVHENKMLEGELVTFDKNDNSIVKRIIISKEAKKEILHQLSRFGITEEFLFADDADKVLRDIVAEQKKRYME